MRNDVFNLKTRNSYEVREELAGLGFPCPAFCTAGQFITVTQTTRANSSGSWTDNESYAFDNDYSPQGRHYVDKETFLEKVKRFINSERPNRSTTLLFEYRDTRKPLEYCMGTDGNWVKSDNNIYRADCTYIPLRRILYKGVNMEVVLERRLRGDNQLYLRKR